VPSGSEQWLKRIGDRQDAQLKRLRLKDWAVRYKGGKCSLCQYGKCLRALEFHHLDPGEKDFDVSSRLGTSPEVLRRELDKCILVCSNCHREIHDGIYPHLSVTEEHLADIWDLGPNLEDD